MDNTSVILVDEQDNPVGTAGKLEAHEKGLLHRAFSVFLFNSKGEMLLQRRALEKYHSGGLWSNACCSHPAPGENVSDAAIRRLSEELGLVAPVKKAFHFVYRANFENGLTEYEFDHVFTGTYDGIIKPEKTEVMDIGFKTMTEINHLLKVNSGIFTAWFTIAFPKLEKWMKNSLRGNLSQQ